MVEKYSVLCVDDEPAVLLTEAAVLRGGGFTVYTATSLDEAQRVLRGTTVNVVVLDASVCNTAQACVYEKLREIQPGLTVVLHTGNPQTLQQECVQDKHTIAKPVPPGELAERLRRILRVQGEQSHAS